MAKTNVKRATVYTHEGAPSVVSSAAKELRRTVMANMLFEDTFYESGVDAATRMASLIKQVSFADAAQAAIDAREKFNVRTSAVNCWRCTGRTTRTHRSRLN